MRDKVTYVLCNCVNVILTEADILGKFTVLSTK